MLIKLNKVCIKLPVNCGKVLPTLLAIVTINCENASANCGRAVTIPFTRLNTKLTPAFSS